MDYARAVALAQKLIEKNGTTVSIQRLSAGPVDADKPWKGAGLPTVAQSIDDAKAVFLPHASTLDLGGFKIDDELMKRCDMVALVAGGAVDLTVFHQFVRSALVLKIEWVRELKPADITVLYAFGVKR